MLLSSLYEIVYFECVSRCYVWSIKTGLWICRSMKKQVCVFVDVQVFWLLHPGDAAVMCFCC